MKSNLKKRMLALTLCMVMVLSGSTSALADDVNANGTDAAQVVQQEQGDPVVMSEEETTEVPSTEQEEVPPAQEETGSGETTEAPAETPAEQSTETPVEEQTETPSEEPVETQPHQDEMELVQKMKDADGNVVCTVKANIPEGTFNANTSEVTMEVTEVDTATTDAVKELMKKNLAENKELGEYFLYKVEFKVNGETVEPGREIKLTFTKKNFEIEDVKKASVFYYNEANSVAGNTEAEIVEITQKDEKIEELQNAGQSIENIEDYDLTEISLKEDGTADKIQTEGRRSTIYGCYVENDKPEEKTEEGKTEENTADKTEETKEEKPAVTMNYENDDVTITVSASEEGIIPENAELKVVPILADDKETEEQYKAVEEELNKKAENETYDIAGFLAYDISFVNEDGEEVEPNGDVKVTMEYKKAAAPEGMDADAAKEADVTVMHLEEDKDGQVKDVVDMSKEADKEKSKVEALQTTDDNEVEKATFVTDSFSTFTITWNVDNYRNFTITVHYVDEDEKEISGTQSEPVEIADMNAVDLTKYATEIEGYENNPTIYRKTYSGQETIRYIKPVTVSDFLGTRYTIQTSSNNNSYEAWLNTWYGSTTGDIYIAYKKQASRVTITDDIVQSGGLIANFTPAEGETGVTYKWYRSDSENGTYEEVERIEYTTGSTISEDGTVLYPAFDEGARKWYKVEVLLDGETEASANRKSEPYQVPYFGELQNGSFETPNSNNNGGNKSDNGNSAQWSNEEYAKQGGVWQTTGTKNGQDIEVLWTEGDNDGQFANNSEDGLTAADGDQLAEINCEAAGALYQDVITTPGTDLFYSFSHRARDCGAIKYPEGNTGKTKYDTMYLVIAPTKEVENCKTQKQLTDYLTSKGVTISTGKETSKEESVSEIKNENGLLVVKATSDSTDWEDIVGEYRPTDSLSRFFFVSGATASEDNTVGNLVDRIGFSQNPPEVRDDEFSILIDKKFEGLDNTGLAAVKENISFEITATENGESLTSEELVELFGKTTITAADMNEAIDGSLQYSLINKKIDKNRNLEVTITEKLAELSEYSLQTTSKTTVTVDETETTTDGVNPATIASLKGQTIAKVEFTNSYTRSKNKKVNFTKIWDDENNAYNTRPESLQVTLTASISVSNADGELETIPLNDLTQTATITEDPISKEWKTSWDVPVYYNYNGVDVKIDYKVTEGEIDSEYVYEATNDGVALEGDGSEYTEYTDFSDVKTESEESEATLSKLSKAGLTSFNKVSLLDASALAADNESDLGTPLHKKYIEYDENKAEYTLNLDVTGAKGEAKGVDILFVIDTSGSMGSPYSTLLSQLKTMLTTGDDGTGIIDRIFASPGNVNSVAYVSFAGKSQTKQSRWYESADKADLESSINSLQATGGTNWTYAMMQASELLNKKQGSTNEKVVIFLSDGKPTYTMGKDGDGNWTNQQSGNGNTTYNSYYQDAADVVSGSTSLMAAKIYSTYLTEDTKDGMETFSDKLSNSELVDGTNLQTALDGILNKVIPTYEDVVITDTLSEYVDLVSADPSSVVVTKKPAGGTAEPLSEDQYDVTISGETVTVKLLNGNPLDDGATYTMSFKVKPSAKANEEYSKNGYPGYLGDAETGSTSAGEEGFYSNDYEKTYVSYKVNGVSQPDANYPKPVVKVTTHELTYKKIWVHPEEIQKPTETVTLEVVYTDGTSKQINLTSASGYVYTETVPVTKKIQEITETGIEGYQPYYDISKDRTVATVTNSYSRVTTNTIEVIKKWDDDFETHDPISVSLYRSADNGNAELVETVSLNENNGYKHEWSNLKLSEGSGENIVYYTYAVREENTPPNYTSNTQITTENGKTVVTITNKYDENCQDENYYIVNVLQTETIELEKVWNDNNNILNKRPTRLSIKVKEGENDEGLTFYLEPSGTSSESWQKTIKLLKKVDTTYTAEEIVPEYYTMEDSYETTISGGKKFTFVNALETTEVIVHKEWNDNEIVTRPLNVQFILQYKEKDSDVWDNYQDEPYSITSEDIVYNEDGTIRFDWAIKIDGLPAIYDYQVEEIDLASGYNKSEIGEGDVFTITNTLKWSVRKTSEAIGDIESEPLAGAEFDLKDEFGNVIATGSSGTDGIINWTPAEGQTNDLQKLTGNYFIHETKAPTGYVCSAKDWKLTFEDGLLTQLDGNSVTGGDAEEGIVVDITNTRVYELPDSGGSGIYWYMIGGMLLMLAAALILYKNKCKEVLGS